MIVADTKYITQTIKYFTAESHESERYNQALKVYFDVSLKSRFSLTILNIGQGYVGTNLLLILIFFQRHYHSICYNSDVNFSTTGVQRR